MTTIVMYDRVGSFGEDKDVAADIRQSVIKPRLVNKKTVVLDFDSVTLVTQSFIHALISDVLRNFGEDALDSVEFKNCSEVVRGIIATVVQYSLDSPTSEIM